MWSNSEIDEKQLIEIISEKENARRVAQKWWRLKMAAAASCDVTAVKRFINSPDSVVLLPLISSIYQC